MRLCGRFGYKNGGDDETRTHYLDNANVALYQMSYAPERKYGARGNTFSEYRSSVFFPRSKNHFTGTGNGSNGKNSGIKITPSNNTINENGTPSLTKSTKR